MNLSLSCRIAEGFLSKREAIMDLAELCHLAVQAPFDSICMRASQLGISNTVDETEKAANLIHCSGLAVSMVSGDFDIVYNNDRGPRCLQDITPYLDLAERLDTQLIRVCIKHEDDLKAAQKAADEAKERQISLVHQCHVQSLFETVDQIESCLRRIGRPNFGLIYEAANLEQCRQDYGRKTIRRLAPWIKNVYLQNQIIRFEGALTLDTWTNGPVSLDNVSMTEPGGIDFGLIFSALKEVFYDGIFTVHQSAPEDGSSPMEVATRTSQHLRSLLSLK